MRKLSLKKIRWIVKEMCKGELSVRSIARQQDITPQHVRRLYHRYKHVKPYKLNKTICLQKCGRRSKPIEEEERRIVLRVYDEMPLGAVKMERYHELLHIPRIPHNRIQRILGEAGLTKPLGKKVKRKKWTRYERKYSNELWHADFTETIDDKQVIAYVDDASRKIMGHGKFDSATTDIALSVLNKAIAEFGRPQQLMTDHGAQFCADEDKRYKFRDALEAKGIQHIMSRVKRPQSNGKIERWFGSAEKLYNHFAFDIDKTVECYNNMPHLSLDTTPNIAYVERMQKQVLEYATNKR